jgi:endonuclease-3
MSIKQLGFDEIKRRAEKFRKTAESFSLYQEFDVGSPEEENFLEENPLAPIIGTICDQQITAEDAWTFPYWLSKQFNGKNLSAELISNLGKNKIKNLLMSFMEGKWPSGMVEKDREKYLENISGYVVNACSLMVEKHANDPDRMFDKGRYIVPEIYFILRTLPGIGPKKASMIARDFVKDEGGWYRGVQQRLKNRGKEFKVEGKHLSEVPVDVHVVKVFGRIMGEFRNTPQRERFLDYWPDIQNFAKVAFPDFPGRIDESLWLVGREYCDERQPNCRECPLNDIPCDYAKR